MNLGLIPLKNFGILSKERRLFRSAQPEDDHQYEWLGNFLKIKTIVNLRSEINIDKHYCDYHGIESITIPVDDHHPPSEKDAKDFIKWIKGRNDVLIHCQHGHGRTSTFSVLTHLSLGLSMEEALKLEKEKFHYAFTHPVQEKFLKNFDFKP